MKVDCEAINVLDVFAIWFYGIMVCQPSRFAVWPGLLPSRHSLRRFFLFPRTYTLHLHIYLYNASSTTRLKSQLDYCWPWLTPSHMCSSIKHRNMHADAARYVMAPSFIQQYCFCENQWESSFSMSIFTPNSWQIRNMPASYWVLFGGCNGHNT